MESRTKLNRLVDVHLAENNLKQSQRVAQVNPRQSDEFSATLFGVQGRVSCVDDEVRTTPVSVCDV